MSTDDDLRAYLREQVEAAVMGGYKSEKQVLDFIEELARHELRDDAEVEQLLAYTRRRLEEHRVEEASWTEPSVNDALDRAFEELTGQGILALQDAGYTLSDGWRVAKAAAERRSEPMRGATFFHGQDVERGVLGVGLMLAFGAFEDDPKRYDEASLAIAREVRETLARHGIETEWNGSVGTRIQIPPFEWRKRRQSSRARRTPTPLDDTDSLQQRVLRNVMQEGLSQEEATAALAAFIQEEALKHYGEDCRIEAVYNPESGVVEVYQALTVVERLDDDPAVAATQRLLEQMRQRGMDVEPGDELVFQIFYRPEDAPESHAQDAQYGEILELKTFGRFMRWSTRALGEGLLKHRRS
ncbi:MAG TPA: NusA N-terminal domain-containing protein [Archangium sp.]|nr:NusA N-terminal domain-containing protein [Archangium sp.]